MPLPVGCPRCGSTDTEAINLGEFSGEEFSVKLACPACGQRWWDVYTRTAVEFAGDEVPPAREG